MPYDNIITGSFTGVDQSLDIGGPNSGTESIQITGTWVGTVVFEASIDGVNWIIRDVVNISNNSQSTSIESNGIYICNVTGLANKRVRSSAWTSGTAVLNNSSDEAVSIITANIGTTDGLALNTTLTGGTQKSIVRGGAKGSTVAADVTSTASGADHQLIDIAIYDASGNQVTSFGGGTQYADGAARGTATGTMMIGDDGTNVQSVSVDTTGKLNVNNISGAISLPTGAATSALQTQPGVDIGDVTINNAGSAAAVNIQDGGNSITVDGTVTVTPPTLTKGTQGATGFSTQDLKDAGRNQTNYRMFTAIVCTSTDTMVDLTGYKGGVAVTQTPTPAVVSAGKTYRITAVTMSYITITTASSAQFTLRANLTGVAVITSPMVTQWHIGEPSGAAPVAGKVNTVHLTFPDGIEFAAGTGIGVSKRGLNTVGSGAAAGYCQISIHGYEY